MNAPQFHIVILCAILSAFTVSAGEGSAPRADQKLGEGPVVVAIEADAAGPDYKVQGEYVGAYSTDEKQKIGAQVVALGFGNFRLVLLNGGLPGDGWDGKAPVELEGKTDAGKTAFASKKSAMTASIGNDLLTGGEDKKNFELKKTVRKSLTLEAKAPPGAVVLFDGKNMDAWENGTMDERKLIKASTQKGTGHTVGPFTKQKFTDFTMHVEFVMPFTPSARGQGRGNSGVYLQNRYEIQVLDSFGLRHGKTSVVGDTCGEIYKKIAPSVNMTFPPLSWQTYDVEYSAAKFDSKGAKTQNAIVSLRHNGVLTIDKQEITGTTGPLGDKDVSTAGAIMLQDHGYPVFYRNVWLVEKK